MMGSLVTTPSPSRKGSTLSENAGLPGQVTVAVARPAECGEGPVWDPSAGVVHWVDIIRGEILRTDLASSGTAVTTYPEMVGAVAPRSRGGVVAAVASGFVGFDADGHIGRRVDCLTDGVRMNDAKTDPRGCWWAGSCELSFAPGRGGLWRLDEDWDATLVLSGLTLPNGMGWSPDGTEFYLVETQDRRVLRFAFDPTTSALDPMPTVLIGSDSFPEGLPDGLTVSADGRLWIAMYGGAAVHEFSAEGELLRSVSIPTQQPTSCAFVGPALDELWVTSAAAGRERTEDPLAGSTFRVHGLGATGLPSEPFRG